MSRSLRSAASALALTPALLLAQPPRTLPAPDATFAEPFTQVSSLRELSNGRVLVTDARDKVLQLLDLGSGSATKIGREGGGPGEYGLPFRLLLAASDTTFLFDVGNQRYLVIGSDGKAAGEFRVEESAPVTGGGGGPVIRMGLSLPRTSDARGRIYWESSPMAPGPDGRPVMADSVAVIRYDRTAKKSDTLSWVRIPKNNTQVSGSQGNIRMMVSPPNPLLPRDEWTVFPDGRVAVLRAPEYRVEWVLANGTRGPAASIPFSPVRMTDADKKEEEVLRNRARQGAMMMTVNADAGGPVRRSAQMGPGANAPPLEPLADWPSVKPPFRSGQASVWARSNGELWVRRTEPAGAKGTLYDVINAQGVVTHQVRIGDGLNLVGFGNGTVYTTKADEDDLLYLQRHRMP